MGYFPVRYDSRVVIYERKMLIRLATESCIIFDLNIIYAFMKCNNKVLDMVSGCG